MPEDSERVVEVCNACLTASCWHGEFMCEKSYGAGTTRMTRRELDSIHREHPGNYSDAKLLEVTGV